MIPAIYTHLFAAGAALAIGASGAAYVQAQRYGLQIETLKHQATTNDLAGERQAVKDMAGFQKGFNDALATFQASTQRNANAARDLDRTLLDLRTTTAGLSGDFAQLPGRIEHASRSSAAIYATTCTALLEGLAERGGRLAERGADIARKADGHSADTGLMQDAWPRAKPASIP